ncbi:MAG TPA: MbnP family protein, partial [Pseudomonadales bacterium]|nr:MbnP family protein [Pseudomonadales bacterium]
MNRKFRQAVRWAGAALCALAGSAFAAEASTPVEIEFAAVVGAEPASCTTTYRDVGSSHAAMFLQDFRIYVSAVRLIAADGAEVPVTISPDGIWQNDRV